MNTNFKEEKIIINKETRNWLSSLIVQTIKDSYTNTDDILSAISLKDFIIGAYEMAKDIMMSCDEDSEDEKEQLKLNKFAQIVGDLEEYI